MTNERTVKGVLGTKLGMTQLWDEHNKLVPVTVIQAGPCVVTQVRTPETDGYSAVQLGIGAVKAKKVTKPEAGHFAKASTPWARRSPLTCSPSPISSTSPAPARARAPLAS